MAGSYPDVPDRRMGYDDDGTVVWAGKDTNAGSGWNFLDNSTIQFASAANLADINDISENDWWLNTSGGPGSNSDWYVAFIFPELREVSGFFIFLNGNGTKYLSNFGTSSDTTNGIDGTWTQYTTTRNDVNDPIGSNYGYSVANLYRTGILLPDSGTPHTCRALRYQISNSYALTGTSANMVAVHIYGHIVDPVTNDRILFIDEATGLEFDAAHDWGDVPRGVTLDKEFRIKNNSASFTANSILLDFETNYLTSDTWHQLKEGAGAFGDTVTVTSLAPGATSSLLTARLSVPDAATVGIQEARLRSTVGSWT